MTNRLRTALVAGALVLAVGFAAITRAGVVPLFMHDDYEYTFPSFSLVRAGDFGSPLMGPGQNIEHRTYNFTLYYYATVHSVLIKVFGDRPESIPLANMFHFVLLLACVVAYGVYRDEWIAATAFVLACVSDATMREAALAGRPEMTAAFGYFVCVLMLYEWQVRGTRQPAVLAAATTGAVLAALTHPAGVIVLAPVFAAFLVANARALWTRRYATALLAPAAVPVLLYAYFAATDDWHNIVLQVTLGNASVQNITWPERYALLVRGRFGELFASARPVLEHFANAHVSLALFLLVVGVAGALWRRMVTRDDGVGARLLAIGSFAGAFAAAMVMHWLFLKSFVLSYTAIYRPAWYLAFAMAIALIGDVVADSFGRVRWREIRTGVLCLAVAVFVASHNTVATAERLHAGFRYADYRGFRREVNAILTKAGARPGDRVYCPSPFGTYVAPEFNAVIFGSERYRTGMWPESFDLALQSKRAIAPDPMSLAYLKNIVFLSPRWIVTWEHDYSILQPFMAYVASFPQNDPDVRITEAAAYESVHTYTGRIRVFRVDLRPAFSDALDRHLDPRRQWEKLWPKTPSR